MKRALVIAADLLRFFQAYHLGIVPQHCPQEATCRIHSRRMQLYKMNCTATFLAGIRRATKSPYNKISDTTNRRSTTF